MSIPYLIVSSLCGIGILWLLFKTFFGCASEFLECIKFWLTPDMVSMFRGEYCEDRWSEMKLGLWLACGIGTGIAVYIGLEKLFG